MAALPGDPVAPGGQPRARRSRCGMSECQSPGPPVVCALGSGPVSGDRVRRIVNEYLEKLLERQVIAPLRPCVGRRLSTVTYRCLKGEAEGWDLIDPRFYMAGELALVLEDTPLFICWREWGEWPTLFSVQASATSLFHLEGRMDLLDGASTKLWRPHVGAILEAAHVLGWGGTPYAVVLRFPMGFILVGSSYRAELGDGDDLIVRDGAEFVDHPLLKPMWSSGPPE